MNSPVGPNSLCATSEPLSKLKKGTLPLLDLRYVHGHLSWHKHCAHSNLSHQCIQHQHNDWEHLSISHPVKWIQDVCVAQMLWEAFSLKLFPLLENKDWSHLKQRAQRVRCCQHVFAILVLKWTTGISPYFYTREACGSFERMCNANHPLLFAR